MLPSNTSSYIISKNYADKTVKVHRYLNKAQRINVLSASTAHIYIYIYIYIYFQSVFFINSIVKQYLTDVVIGFREGHCSRYELYFCDGSSCNVAPVN